MNSRYYIFTIAFCVTIVRLPAVFKTNILQPYNILLQPDPLRESRFSFQLGYEGIVSAKGLTPHTEGYQNVLALYQCEQDAIAAFKGFPSESLPGQYAQIFNINDDNGTHGMFKPRAHLLVPFNGLFGIQGTLAHNVSLHAYVPLIYAELTDVSWYQENKMVEFEDMNFPQLLPTIGILAGINLFNGWKHLDFGDTVIFAKWYHDYIQMKPVLRNVRLSVRGGFNLPTGKKENICELLGLPFGYDQGYGVYFAGFIALHMVHNWRFMIDLEFLQLFGNTKMRRIKTDPAQTDLLLIAKERVFVDPGFTQQYTFMLEKRSFYNGMSAALYYQYFKHNDDAYYPTTNSVNFSFINDAESVQEYTTHQFIFRFNYEFNQAYENMFRPNIMLFGKYGFNGKRAIVTSSVGIQFTFIF